MKKNSQKTIVILIIFGLIISIIPVSNAFAETLPAQAFISGFAGHAQTMPLSCESRSAVDVAAFWGKSIGESTFFDALPKSDNPDVGFVGNVYGAWGQIPPYPYGVHAKPIAKTLNSFGVPATAHMWYNWELLKQEIANGRPVIVWVIGHVWSGTYSTYKANDGSDVRVAPYEHSMVAIGYDENYIQLVDAGNGYMGNYSISAFKNSWGVLGNLAVTVSGTNPKVTKTYSTKTAKPTEDPKATKTPIPTKLTGDSYTVQSGDTLAKIAKAFGISWVDLAAYNGISYPYTIYPGQILKKPPKDYVAPKTPVPSKTETPDPTKTPKPSETPKPTETPVPTDPGGNIVYTVKKGDYLTKIARKFGVDWKDIVELNGLEYPYVLTPGMELLIPVEDEEPVKTETPTPEPAEDPTEEPTEEPAEEPVATEDPNDDIPDTYVVQKGEYLLAIAKKFGLDFHTLAALNNIVPPYVVFPGQELILK